MKAFFGWLLNRAVIYVLLVAAIAVSVMAWPSLADLGRETMGRDELIAEVAAVKQDGQDYLARAAKDARNLPLETLRARIGERKERRAELEKGLEGQSEEWLAPYLPSRILEQKSDEIEIAVIDREIALFQAALEPRAAAAQAAAYVAENPTIPTMRSIAASRRACISAGEAVEQFDELSGIEKAIRNLLRDESENLAESKQTRCEDLKRLTQRREAGIAAARALVKARDELEGLAAEPLPETLSKDIASATLRDILLQALAALIIVTLLPYALRVICYYVLAPIAERRPPIRFDGLQSPFRPAQTATSSISLPLRLRENEVALVRQDFLQSTSLASSKRTQWLMDWRHPVASFASGMRFLTRIESADEAVIISAFKDPLAEVTLLEIPEGSAVVVRPRAIAAITHAAGETPHLASHWHIFSLVAWLTLQLRYFTFHGPARLVLKGGRGVRIEAAEHGRMLGQDQVIGFSTDLSYSVIRTETFAPYFFGQVGLLKDRVEAVGDTGNEGGVLIIEEAPLAGKSGIRRGLEGALDAMLRAFGV
jgi:hypothetical protein